MLVTQCGTTCQLDGPEYDRDDACAYLGHKLRASDTPKMGTIPIATSSSHILIALLCHPMYERCSLQLWPCQQGPSHWPGHLRIPLRLKCIYLVFNNVTLAHSSVFACPECFWIYQLRVVLPCVSWGKNSNCSRSLPFQISIRFSYPSRQTHWESRVNSYSKEVYAIMPIVSSLALSHHR